MHRITIEYYSPTDTESFERYYTDVHVPIAMKIPGLQRVTLSRPRGLGTVAPYLVAELWFRDGDALRTALTSPEMGAAAADAATFDVGETRMFSAEVVETTA